jgi:hypothetical protein
MVELATFLEPAWSIRERQREFRGWLGVGRLARRVRKDLASPMSPAGLGELRHAVRNGIRITDDVLARAGLRLDALPAPTRRAYQFLVGIDFGSVQTSDTAPSSEPPQASVRFDGLSSWLGSTLTRLSQAEDDSRLMLISACMCHGVP